MKNRLDKELTLRKMVETRSQAENYIKLGLVKVNGREVYKPSFFVSESDLIEIEGEQYVSRAAMKLASVADQFKLDFTGKTILDVGSSTGGFSDYALQHGAKKIVAVDVGTDQLHEKLRKDSRVKLHEKTDIREFKAKYMFDYIVADVSFISLKQILPSLRKLSSKNTKIIAMCKPQFEAGRAQINKGIIKNKTIRREILKDFEKWLTDNNFVILEKADSQIAGTKGNLERFYKIIIK